MRSSHSGLHSFEDTPGAPSGRRALSARRVVAVLIAAILAVTAVTASSVDATASAVGQARADLADASAARVRAERELAELQSELADVEAEIAKLTGESGDLARQISDLRAEVRQNLVRAFISSGGTEQAALLMTLDNTQDLSRGQALLEGSSAVVVESAQELDVVRSTTTAGILRLADEFEALRTDAENARSDLMQAEALEADAERRLVEARAAVDEASEVAAQRDQSTQTTAQRAGGTRAPATTGTTAPGSTGTTTPRTTGTTAPTATVPAATSTTTPTTTTPPPPTTIPSTPGQPTEAQWLRLRQCESGNNYSAVSPSGKYRGAYQFSQSTWESLGGTGDPAAASPAEQDKRARMLYAARGSKPWPHCGRHLN